MKLGVKPPTKSPISMYIYIYIHMISPITSKCLWYLWSIGDLYVYIYIIVFFCFFIYHINHTVPIYYYLSDIHMFYLIDMYGFWGSYGFDLPKNPSSVTIAARETWRSAVSSLPGRMTSRRCRSAFGDPTGDPTGDHGRWAGEYGWRWCNAYIYVYHIISYLGLIYEKSIHYLGIIHIALW